MSQDLHIYYTNRRSDLSVKSFRSTVTSPSDTLLVHTQEPSPAPRTAADTEEETVGNTSGDTPVVAKAATATTGVTAGEAKSVGGTTAAVNTTIVTAGVTAEGSETAEDTAATSENSEKANGAPVTSATGADATTSVDSSSAPPVDVADAVSEVP